jgi:hypothetical protein
MSAKLTWVDILNEQALWTSYEDLITWFSSLLGRPAQVTESALEDFQAGLNFIRRAVSAFHFHEQIDIDCLNNHLKDVNLELGDLKPGADPYAGVLPAFRARVDRQDDDSILMALKQTFIVQFASFVGETIEHSSGSPIARCEGIYREGSATHLSPVQSFPEDIELRWRKEIQVLSDAGLEKSPEIQRCADFFLPRTKGRFCSDECRFRTFQLTKQLADPGYLAAKQKRYRNRQEKGS